MGISTFVAVILLLALGGMSSILIHRLADISQKVVETQNAALRLNEIKGMTETILSLTELHIKSEDGVSMGLVAGKIEETEAMLEKLIAEVFEKPSTHEDDLEMKAFYNTWNQFDEIRHQVIGLSDLFSSQAADGLLTNSGLPLFVESQVALENRMSYYQSTASRLGKRAAAAERISIVLIFGFSVFFVVMMVTGGLIITRSITNPLLMLSAHLRTSSSANDTFFGQDSSKDDNELKTLIRSLEIQVQNRTAELLASNRRLGEEIQFRKLKEAEIKDRERKYRQIFHNTAAWMAYTSFDGRFIEGNISLIQHLGYCDDELQQMKLLDLIPDAHASEYDQFVRELKDSGKAQGILRLTGKTGQVYILDYQSNVIPNEQTQAMDMIVHFAKDITREKEAESAFRQSELRFRDLVDALPLSYFITDHNRALVFANRKTEETFNSANGVSAGQALEPDFMEMLIPEDRQRAMNKMADTRETGVDRWQRYSCLRKDGSVFPCEILTTPVKYSTENEKKQHILVDISERLEKEELIKQKEIAEAANKAISEWLNFVAHELRNPLGGISSFARFGIKKNGAVPQEKLSFYFEQINKAAERLEVLLSDLLDLSKMEIGETNFKMEIANMLTVVQEVQMENEALLIEKGLRLQVESPDNGNPFLIRCDRYRIGQVIRNLLSNAIKFTPAERKIVVRLSKTVVPGRINTDDRIAGIRFDISDEGIGIPEDQLEFIFNKFKQSRKTRTGEGTGLGLPICRQIVESHGGRIWVKSTESKGATFSFCIPFGDRPVFP
ncbi:PAS domain S-box protein [bacterium]|nr:PAS domain S-box protein [bacterium]